METRPQREAASSAANAETAFAGTPPEAPRRRGPGAAKRKAASGSLPSGSSKRLAKERNNPFALLPPVLHNGPVTRARQSPGKLLAAAGATEQIPAPAVGGGEARGSGDSVPEVGDETVEKEEPFVDLEFEAVRSRGSDAHVVPTHAGWFSWKKVHPIEEQTMDSFFNGKVENRTSEVYVEIRNSIVKRFHGDPQTQIELKDLSDLSVGDMEARQEVLEFLDHWGLVNFHPFPSSDSDACEPELDSEANGESKDFSLIEKLYKFNVSQLQVSSGLVPKKTALSASNVHPQFHREPKSRIFEVLARPEEPSVEYHCNACSGDCTRKRYHCQKQADFDLCTECYNAEKFGQGIVASDFILMDSSSVLEGSGGSWTDQETLLLLEALELFGANWNEIAEHVATKTKAQCILHFIQMPIEDPFLEDSDDPNIIPIANADPTLTSAESDGSDIPQSSHAKSLENGAPPTSPPKDVKIMKDGEVLDDANKNNANIVLDALKKAFQAVGTFSEQDGSLSFTEAGNPVMALAAFIAGIVEPEYTTISTRSSLKAIYEDSPGIQLATRHCLLLEDPPNDNNDQLIDLFESKKDDQLNDDINSLASKSEIVLKEEAHAQTENGLEAPKETAVTDRDEIMQTNEELTVSTNKPLETLDKNESDSLLLSKKGEASADEKDSCDSPKESRCLPEKVLADNVDDVIKDKKELASHGEDSAISISITSKEIEGTADKDKIKSAKDSDGDLPVEAKSSTDGELACTTTQEEKENIQITSPSGSGDKVEKTALDEAGKDSKDVILDKIEEDSKPIETDHQNDWKKIRRAAVTALGATAVKAKILARQEEDQIRQLTSLVIGKQLHKLEWKLALLNDVDGVIMRVREQLDRARKKLFQERTQIIAARYGGPASSSRIPQGSLPMRYAAAHGIAMSRQPNLPSQKPPTNKP